LKVRSLEAVGQILSCPKCGGMVHAAPPPGWKPPEPGSTSDSASGPISASDSSVTGGSRAATPAPTAQSSTTPLPAARRTDAAPLAKEPVSATPAGAWTTDPAAFEKQIAARPPEPRRSLSGSMTQESLIGPAEVAAGASAPPAATSALPAPTAPTWLPWMCVPLAGALSAATMWWWLATSSPQEPTLPTSNDPTVATIADNEPATEPSSPASAPQLSWVPTNTHCVVSLQPAALRAVASASRLVDRVAPWWAPSTAALYAALELRPDQVRRITWIDPNLAKSPAVTPERTLCVVELREPLANMQKWLSRFEKVPHATGSTFFYRAPAVRWPQPLVLLDPQTVAIGPIERLVSLGAPHLEAPAQTQPGVDKLLRSMALDAPVLFAVDLVAARHAEAGEFMFPTELWGIRRNDWLVLRDLPTTAGLTLAMSDAAQCRLTLVCETDSDAQQVRAAADAVVAGLKHTIGAERAALVKNLASVPLTTATADQLDLLLGAAQATLETLKCEVRQQSVVLDAALAGPLPRIAEAALAGTSALELTRLAAARTSDEDHQRRLLEALKAHNTQQHSYPAGAAGAALLNPETRLSWIATLLPYYGQFEWHRELKFGRPWNDVDNQPITRRPLDAVINPALGLSTTAAGYPVTHYVGVAGLGADAATLDAHDPRAGVFGYNRRIAPEQIADGAAYTIAVAGVSGKLGPWAAGGESTVRAFTTRPYIDGPDGFGSGQPQGLLVGMADGSVRWISKDVDPEVLEALVTVHGSETIDERRRAALGWLTIDKRHVQPADEPPAPAEVAPAPMPPAAAVVVAPAEPPRTDVADRLADPVPAVDFKLVPLGEFIEFVSQMSTLPITIDLDALVEAGVHPDDKISVTLAASTVGKMLENVLATCGLVYVVQDGQVVVTHPRRKAQTSETVRYEVDDLLGHDPQELVKLVTQFVEPGTWAALGGHGTAKLDGTSLVVRQSALVQSQVETLLEKLRTSRGLPLRSTAPAGRFTLTTRSARARAKLATPVTVNFRDATALGRVIDYLQSAAQVQLPIDGMALVAVGRTAQSPATLLAAETPLSTALDQMLAPLGLAWRAIDEHAIQITSGQVVSDHCELEFYRASDLLKGATASESLVEHVQTSVAPNSWLDAGGAGAIRFDAASKCLLVWQSQPIQRQVEAWLEAQRSKK
ncbi:MAG TPA: DUF1559 domain-containing protein, partial [Pirellulales bacterium]|nr:DUF1559 domain-containing protein [Pirellulales bacterium]